MYQTIPSLQPGAKIGLCCTARFLTPEGLQSCIETLSKWGYEVVLGKHVYAKDRQFGGTDRQRAEDLQHFLDDPSIKAVLFGKGGYGTVRMVDYLNWEKFTLSPKWLCGFSDITVLHSHVHQILGLPTLHSPMALNFQPSSVDTAVLESLQNFWKGNGLSVLETDAHPQNRVGEAKGKLVGGNLSILYALAGSDSDLDTAGKILFLEDLDEYLYHIDRMLWQLKRAGKLKNLAGLVIGGMTEMKDNTEPFGKTVEEIIREAVSEYAFPVGFGFEIGHIKRNFPVVLGEEVHLKVTERGAKLRYK